jgi:tetratricopeptide (TPR) repeat protein
LLALLAAAAALWARGPLRQRWLVQQPLVDLGNYVAARPADTPAALVLAERLLESGDPVRAEEVVVGHIQQDPTNPRLWLLRSQAEFEQGKLAPAYASLQVAMPFLDRSAEAHWRLGLLRERRDEEAAAEAEFRRAIELDPNHVGARLELARSALAHLHYSPALEHLEVVIRQEPENTQALEALALAHRYLGHLDEAEKYAREAVRLAPRAAGSWRALAQVLRDRATDASMGEAKQAYQQALERAPESSELHHELGMIYFGQGDFGQAAAQLQRSIDLHPLNRQAYPTLIQCYRRLGQHAAADRLAREYLHVEEMDLSTAPLEYQVWAMPENTAVRMKLARLYLRYKRPDLALTQVERVLEINPSHTEARGLRERLKATPTGPAPEARR